MAYAMKRNGRFHVAIRKKGYPQVFKSFQDLKTANKFIRTVESQMGVTCLKITQGLLPVAKYEAIF